jgi:ABC-type phosphate/phosphonate transport system ATPase subunit
MIEIKNISKKFGKLQALDGLNLNLNYGECIALIGTMVVEDNIDQVYPWHGYSG